MKVAPRVASKVYSCFFYGIVQTTPNYKDRTSVCKTGRRLEVGFSHYLTLNWISVNKLRLRLTYVTLEFLRLNFLMLNWILRSIHIIMVSVLTLEGVQFWIQTYHLSLKTITEFIKVYTQLWGKKQLYTYNNIRLTKACLRASTYNLWFCTRKNQAIHLLSLWKHVFRFSCIVILHTILGKISHTLT